MSRLGIKIMLIMGIALFISTASTGLLGYFVSKQILTNKVVSTDIVNLADKKSSELESIIGKAVETSMGLADDPVTLKWFRGGEKDEVLGQLAKQRLTHITKQFGYPSVSAVSRKTFHYWTSNGKLLDTISKNDPHDVWFFNALKSSQKVQINLDYNKELNETFVFLNVLMGNPNRPDGIAGVSLSLSDIARHFVKHDFGDLGQIWLINDQGKIQMGADNEAIGKSLAGNIPERQLNEYISYLKSKPDYDTHVFEYTDPKDGAISVAVTKIQNTDWITVIKIRRDHWIERELQSIRRGGFYSAGISLLIVMGIIAIVMYRMGKVFTRISQAIVSLGEKNFTYILPESDLKKHDELGDIARGYEKSRKNLASILAKITGDIQQNIENLSSSSAELSQSSKEMQQTSDNIAEDIEDSASELNETNHTVQKIAHTIHDIANQIEGIQKSADLASDNATQGAGALEKTKSTMAKIEESSRKIEGIIKVITDIADQTNLLSLNATIEAAKAGEFGKGFSVVADEVRSLAERSSESVVEISQLIEISSLNVKDGHLVNKETELIFKQIIQQIQEINDNTRKVNKSIVDQDAGIQEVVKATNIISNLIKNNASATTELAATSNEISKTIGNLSNMAQSLENSLGEFKL